MRSLRKKHFMFPKSPKYAEQIEILAVYEKSVATRWRMETEAMKISVYLTLTLTLNPSTNYDLTETLTFDIAWSPSYERLSHCINNNSFPECFIVLFGYFLRVPKVRVFIQTFSLAKSRSTNSSNFRESSEP